MSTPPDRFPLSLRLAAIAWMLVAAGCVFASLSRTEVLHDDDFMHDISVEDFGWPLTSFERVTFVRKNATKSTSTYKDYFDLSPFLVNSALVALLLCSTAIVFWIFHAQLFRPRFTLRRLLLAFVAVGAVCLYLTVEAGMSTSNFYVPDHLQFNPFAFVLMLRRFSPFIRVSLLIGWACAVFLSGWSLTKAAKSVAERWTSSG